MILDYSYLNKSLLNIENDIYNIWYPMTKTCQFLFQNIENTKMQREHYSIRDSSDFTFLVLLVFYLIFLFCPFAQVIELGVSASSRDAACRALCSLPAPQCWWDVLALLLAKGVSHDTRILALQSQDNHFSQPRQTGSWPRCCSSEL